MSNQPGYGKAISLKEANAIIGEYKKLNKIVKREIPNTLKGEERLIAEEFSNGNYNAFIFSKELVLRFFNDNNDDENADFLLVLLGAHPKDLAQSDDFKPGSFTVVTTGCKKVVEDEKILFRTLKIKDPGNEYPPKKMMAKLVSIGPKKEGKDDDYLEFEIV